MTGDLSNGRVHADYSYEMLNDQLREQQPEIRFKDGRYIEASNVVFTQDSISFLDTRTNKPMKMHIQQVRQIVSRNHFIGAAEGFGLGAAIGGGVGAAAGRLINIQGTAEYGSQNSEFGTLVGLVVGGGVGIIVGSIFGAMRGHVYTYQFP
jgi:hypothetical protein